jgi:hypothetical protein
VALSSAVFRDARAWALQRTTAETPRAQRKTRSRHRLERCVYLSLHTGVI